MGQRIALASAMLIVGVGLVFAAPSIPMTRLAPVSVALGCVAIVVSITVLLTLDATPKAAIGMCLTVVASLVIAAWIFDVVTPYRNNRVSTSAELWDPKENAIDHVENLQFSYNRQGWRTARETSDFRANDDVVLLGDSIVFGIVSDKDTIEAQLRSMLLRSRVERDVLTLAVPGIGLIVYETLSEIAARMQPAWTYLFVYVDNDFTQRREFDLPWLARFLDTSSTLRALSSLPSLVRGALKSPGEPATRLANPVPEDTLIGHARRRTGVNRGVVRWIPVVDERLYETYSRNAAHPEVGRILARINDNLGGKLCVVIVPSKYQVFVGYEWVLKGLGYRPDKPMPTTIQDVIEATGAKHGICVLNAYREVLEQDRNGRLYYSVDDHPNAAGNCLLAKLVLADLKKRGMADIAPAATECSLTKS